MRRVIATVAFGGVEYFTLAEVLFESLQRAGSTAERVCVGDRVYPFPKHLNVTCIVAPRSASLKAAAMQLVGLEPGDFGMLVDSDMVFTKNPDFLLEGDAVRVATTGVPLASSSFGFNRMFLTQGEIASLPLGRRCINTGLVVFPGSVASRFAEAWGAFHAEHRGDDAGDYITVCDQPALEAMLWRGILKAELLPWELMHFPAATAHLPADKRGVPAPECVVLHFTGYSRDKIGKNRIERDMRQALERLHPAGLQNLTYTKEPA